MEDIEGDALADVAYGLFEILLNKELRKQGSYLFERVEREEDFRDDFEDIFEKFRKDYPQLAEALLKRFEETGKIYTMICSGEGIVPTKTTQMYWIVQDTPAEIPPRTDAEQVGKWLIFLERDEADEMWKKIRNATTEGKLGISTKVSTAKENPESRDNRIVIYSYTADWEDEPDVMRVREVLRELGIEQRIGYKRNIETYHGEYSDKGKKVTYYSV